MTEDDLQAAIAFYESPPGRNLVACQVMSRRRNASRYMRPELEQVIRDIQENFIEAFQATMKKVAEQQ
jgi:hypothetical protein